MMEWLDYAAWCVAYAYEFGSPVSILDYAAWIAQYFPGN